MSAENGAAPTAVAKRDTTPLMRRDPMGLAHHFAASGFFSDARDVSKAVVKIVAGEELGLGPMASMRGVHIIEGAPSLSANVLATLVKRSERYDFRVRESTEQKCLLEFFEDGESVGTVEFTIEQAAKIKTRQKRQWIPLSKTLRWENSPVDMLFARCLTRGVRQFAADVTAGTPAYTPDELGAETNAQGEPVFVEAQVEQAPAPADDQPRLDDETLDRLVQGYKIAGSELGGLSNLDGLNILLGSLGHDGIEAEPDLDMREEMAKFSPELAEQVESAFQAAIDRATVEHVEAEEVDGEIVDEAPAGEEAADARA